VFRLLKPDARVVTVSEDADLEQPGRGQRSKLPRDRGREWHRRHQRELLLPDALGVFLRRT